TSIKDADTLDVKGLEKEHPLIWNGTVSAYFDALVRMTDGAGATLTPASVRVSVLTPNEPDVHKHAVAIATETPEFTVPAGGASSFTLNTYFGPKLRAILNNNYYASFPLDYSATLVMKTTTGFGQICGLCTWSWLVDTLVWALQQLHFVLRDWGLAIIGLVLIVRLLLHPVTKKSQISMSRMTKMGPELERLKKK